jgi:hypothetical protein
MGDVFKPSQPSPPPAPDYTSAANATAQGNLEATRAAIKANRVNQKTPYGYISWNQEGSDPDAGWSVTQSLSPEQQKLFDQNMRINRGLGDVSEQGLGYVQSALDKPLSFSGMQELMSPGQIQQAASDAAYKNAMRYVEPRMQRQQSQLENQLANQGITRGSEAWNAAMQDAQANQQNIYDQAQNNAYLQGLQGAGQAYSQALGRRQQQIGEAQTLRQDPINMLNAVRSGSQMQVTQLPQQMQVPLQATAAGPDLLGATQAQAAYNQSLYNANSARSSNALGGLFGLAGAGIGGAFGGINGAQLGYGLGSGLGRGF